MPAREGKRRPSLYERLEGKRPARRQVVIPLSDEAVQTAAAAQRELQRETVLGSDESRAAAQAKLDEARAALREQAVTLTLEALPRDEWDALQRAHAATPEQVAEAKAQFGSGAYVPWNADTFLPAAWEACQVPDEGDGRLSYEQCASLIKRWSSGEQESLLRAIQDCNSTTVSVEALGK